MLRHIGVAGCSSSRLAGGARRLAAFSNVMPAPAIAKLKIENESSKEKEIEGY